MFKDSITLFALHICMLKTLRNCLYGLFLVLETHKQSSSVLDQMEQGGNYADFHEFVSKWSKFIHLCVLHCFSQ